MALMVDFVNDRLIVRTHTAFFPSGVALEEIPAGRTNFAPGMVLVKGSWRRIYFLAERDGWSADDYFIHAAKLMGQQGIREP